MAKLLSDDFVNEFEKIVFNVEQNKETHKNTHSYKT